jgi:hypothetical protein
MRLRLAHVKTLAHALCIGAAAAVLVGCGALRQVQDGMQPPIGVPAMNDSANVLEIRHEKRELLYVDDGGNQTVEILKNGTWKEVRAITEGIGDIDRNWVDRNGNFYFAQFSPVEIVEYARRASSPTFTYYSEMQLPVDVTTDRAGNVYEADELTSSINEYAQQSNSVSASCGNGAKLFLSVAVDRRGDVFVGYVDNEPYGRGHIYEYSGGLTGCHATELGVALTFPGGMALDKNDDIIICDQGNNSVDIVAPPYNKVSGTLGSGYSAPSSVRLNRKNDRAYVVNGNPQDVLVVQYPNGTLIKELGADYGISEALGAVDSDNFNP